MRYLTRKWLISRNNKSREPFRRVLAHDGLMTTTQKTLIAAIVVFACTAAVGTYVVQQVKTRASSARVAVNASPPVSGATYSENGILKTPDGKPLPDADVFLTTASASVPIYSAAPPKVAVARTGADGRFSFPLDPKNRAIIVVHEKGYGQVTVTELEARHELTLQPWARVEGTLREGSTPLAGETIHLSRERFGSQIERDTFRTHHDTTTETDAAGHYVFPRVAPGDAWISWLTERRQRPGSTNKYDLQTRYVDIQPGQSLIADIGGRGRPITGRAVLAESDAQVRHFGSVWPRPLHQMRRPPNWSELSTKEKAAWTAAWEKSPDAKLYNQEKCNIAFRPAADGTFIVPDVPAGEYRIWLGGWTTVPWVQISRGDLLVTVPEMSGGRSDEPLDVGEIKTYSFRPLRTGEPAPLFETSTFDGKPLKLADFKGKHVLLSFWRSDDAKSLADLANLKTAQAAWGKDQRFVLIGLNLDGTLAAAQQYATDNKLTWVQCYLGERSDVPMRYHLLSVASSQTWDSGPKSVLIGPDGLMIREVRGPKIAATLENVLSTRVKTRITQPGDLIFASSGNSRGSEGVANAIDNDETTKYLNWDSGRDGNQIGTFSPSGFAVQPAVGPTVVTGMGIQSANDASDRDPDVVVLEGSNDTDLTSYESGTWTPITTISNIAAGFTARFESQEFFFSNATPYRNYRWRVEATRTTPNRCCMQVAEVWLTTSAPSNQAGSPAAAELSR
jgi:peroxiredoxin